MEDQTLHGASAAGLADVVLGMPRIMADLADGLLSDSEATAVADWLVATSDEPVPFWLVNRAVRIPARTLVQEAPRPSAWRRLVAALVFDTQLQPRPAGARAVGSEPRRLLYRADATEIDLEIGPSQITGRLRMHGQVTASTPDPSWGWVIAEGSSGRFEADVDAMGQFALDGLVAGVHRLEIGVADELIEIPAVPL